MRKRAQRGGGSDAEGLGAREGRARRAMRRSALFRPDDSQLVKQYKKYMYSLEKSNELADILKKAAPEADQKKIIAVIMATQVALIYLVSGRNSEVDLDVEVMRLSEVIRDASILS